MLQLAIATIMYFVAIAELQQNKSFKYRFFLKIMVKMDERRRLEMHNRATSLANRMTKERKTPILLPKSRIVLPTKEEQIITAIVSDIHGNWEALRAVKADITERGIKSIKCLGDIIGYGGQWFEVLGDVINNKDLWEICSGNHEKAIIMAYNSLRARGRRGFQELADPLGTLIEKGIGQVAAEGMVRTAELIACSEYRQNILNYLRSMPDQVRIGNHAVGIHGFKEKIDDLALKYVMPQEIAEGYGIKDKQIVADPVQVMFQSRLFEDGKTNVIFIGHSHVPFAVIIDQAGNIVQKYIPSGYHKGKGSKIGEIGRIYIPKDHRAVVNVGGAGATKRRDVEYLKQMKKKGNDNWMSANWVEYDGDSIIFHEIYYDYRRAEQATIQNGFPNIFQLEVAS
jgi:predicted phosphodiesterase